MEKTPTLLEADRKLPYSFQGSLKTHGSGRKKGTPNALHTEAKWCVKEVFRLCGGVDGMLKWAKKYPSEFYPLYIRTLVPKPIEINEEDGQITLIIQRGLTAAPTPPLQLNTTTGSGQASTAEDVEIAHE